MSSEQAQMDRLENELFREELDESDRQEQNGEGSRFETPSLEGLSRQTQANGNRNATVRKELALSTPGVLSSSAMAAAGVGETSIVSSSVAATAAATVAAAQGGHSLVPVGFASTSGASTERNTLSVVADTNKLGSAVDLKLP